MLPYSSDNVIENTTPLFALTGSANRRRGREREKTDGEVKGMVGEGQKP